MTLITQFKNQHLSFIAGDGVINFSKENIATKEIVRSYKNNFDKVFKCHNLIVGIFGFKDDELIDWLNDTFKKHDKKEIEEKLSDFFGEMKVKHCFDEDIPSSEGINLIQASENMCFLFSSKFKDHIIPLGQPVRNENVEANKYKLIATKEYFFSPQLNELNEIDFAHQKLLEYLFKRSFEEVYAKEYDKNVIQFDDKLNELIKLFYTKVYANPDAHKNCIAGRVSYSSVSDEMASEIKYIDFDLPPDFAEEI